MKCRWIEAERKGKAEKEEKGPLNEEEGVDVISVVLPDVQHHYTAFFEAARSPFLSSFGRCVDVTATKQIPLLKTRNVQNSDRSGFARFRTTLVTKCFQNHWFYLFLTVLWFYSFKWIFYSIPYRTFRFKRRI